MGAFLKLHFLNLVLKSYCSTFITKTISIKSILVWFKQRFHKIKKKKDLNRIASWYFHQFLVLQGLQKETSHCANVTDNNK